MKNNKFFVKLTTENINNLMGNLLTAFRIKKKNNSSLNFSKYKCLYTISASKIFKKKYF